MGGKLKIKNAQKPGQPAAPTDPQAAMKASVGRIAGNLSGGRPTKSNGIFGNIRSMMGAKLPPVNPNKLAIPQAPGKPLGQAQPASAAAAQALQSPMSPPPGKGMGQAATPEQEAAQRASIEENRKNMNITTGPDGKKFNTMRLGEAQPSPVASVAPVVNPMEAKQKEAALAQPMPVSSPSPVSEQPAPQVVSPAASMQAQKDQMFPPAPATPAAPVAPAPVTPPIAPKPAQVTPPAGVNKSQADIDEEKKKQMAGMAGMAKTVSGNF